MVDKFKEKMMIRFFKYNYWVVLIALIIVACHRQRIYSLTEQWDSAKVEVEVDWSLSQLEESNIGNVSLYAYTEGLAVPYIRISGDPELAYIYLAEGEYTLLLFNDMVEDLLGIEAQGVDSLERFRFLAVERTSLDDIYYEVATGELLLATIGAMATWHASQVVVTAEMIACNCCEDEAEHDSEHNILLEASPTPITTPCQVNLAVDNLNNAVVIQGVLRGFAAGAYMTSGERIASEDVVPLYFLSFDDRTYSNSTDGVTSGELITFGKVEAPSSEEQSYQIEIDVILGSGERVSFTRDVTEQVAAQDNTNIVIDLTSNDNMITLPAALGTGFGVEEWGDNEPIELL